MTHTFYVQSEMNFRILPCSLKKRCLRSESRLTMIWKIPSKAGDLKVHTKAFELPTQYLGLIKKAFAYRIALYGV